MENIELPAGSEPLANQQHENLAQAYVETANKKKAGEKAGYTDKSNAFRAILRTDVQERIKFLQEERAEELGLDSYYVLSKLKDNLEASMSGAEPNRAAANKAIEMLGKHLGMFAGKIEHSGTIEIQSLSDLMDELSKGD
ncbi:terminase small subunit [Acinetobacter guillouiae]|uniref:terminase small subunit n=1 Tax=Acinetobacter guillouiae TaxID=106649 RepID=UPI003C6EE486